MWKYFHIGDYSNVVDIEINKVDQQIFGLDKRQPKTREYEIFDKINVHTSATSGSSLSSTNT